MKALVFGSRMAKDKYFVWARLDRLHEHYQFTCVVTGAYGGIDLFAEEWAKDRAIKYIGVPAKWTEQGLAAGPIRNQRMIDEEKPDIAIGFPGGTGTADMARRCATARVQLIRIEAP